MSLHEICGSTGPAVSVFFKKKETFRFSCKSLLEPELYCETVNEVECSVCSQKLENVTLVQVDWYLRMLGILVSYIRERETKTCKTIKSVLRCKVVIFGT